MYNKRGIGRYMYDLFERAIGEEKDTAYILLARGAEVLPFPDEIQRKIVYCYLEDFQSGMYKDNEFDVYINGTFYFPTLNASEAISGLYPEFLMKTCKIKTCIVHDFIPLFFCRQYIPDQNTKLSFALQTETVKYMDHVFSNSKFTKYSIARYPDVDLQRITCIYGGVDEKRFKTKNSNLPYDGASRKHHLVYVSGAAPQKNNEAFVRAFCKAYRNYKTPKDATLYIICGANEEFITSLRQETEACGCKYGKQVVATGYISDEKMKELISTAKCSMFPSYLEGLGLPILESYAAGTPCFASCSSATREFVLKDCSFDPFDEGSMIDAITSAYLDDELCSKSLEYGRKLLTKINYGNAAQMLLAKCKELSDAIC